MKCETVNCADEKRAHVRCKNMKNVTCEDVRCADVRCDDLIRCANVECEHIR